MKTTLIGATMVAVLSLLTAVGLSACGSSSDPSVITSRTRASHYVPAPPVADPQTVVARIGSYALTKGALQRWIDVYAKVGRGEEVPDAPGFARCVGNLQKQPQHTVASARLTTSQLRQECSQQYEELKEQALGELIYLHWLVGSGRETGANVSNADAQRAVEATHHKRYPTEAKYRAFLARTGYTVADLLLLTRANLIELKIRAKIQKSVGPVTHARVAAYYNANRGSYSVPEKRDLKIVRALTKSAALKARREIVSGKSFAEVVKRGNVPQPIYSSAGLVIGLAPGVYSEPPLNDAIFAAKPDVLSGPVGISLGYYVFEVTRIHKAHQTPLSQVAAGISQQLPALLQSSALYSFLTRWKARWTARTTCQPGYVIWKCREFKGSPPISEYPTSFF